MKYERLTKKCSLGIGLTRTSGNITEDYIAVVNRLAEIEDKIDDGLLVELPCKVGDTVYEVGMIYQGTMSEEVVVAVRIDADGIEIETTTGGYPVKYIGALLFFDRGEAEAKLKELWGE